MTNPLSNDEQVSAELYAIKIVVVCLIDAYLKTQPDRDKAARELISVAQNTVGDFRLIGAMESAQALVREAMTERIEKMVLSASIRQSRQP